MSNEDIDKFKDLLSNSSKIVILTGAGISTESGISDYRSKGGLWDRFQPITIQEFLADEDKRKEYWLRKQEFFSQIENAEPNLGHLAIAKLENQGKLLGLITQNIDGLHQKAGSRKILEIHGTNREVICLSCGKIDPFETAYERINAGEEAPLCLECQGFLKPNTISFGQALDVEVLQNAIQWAQSCDLFIAIGSTLVVEPAASLPQTAKRYGASFVIINHTETPYTRIADLNFSEDIGTFLDQVISE